MGDAEKVYFYGWPLDLLMCAPPGSRFHLAWFEAQRVMEPECMARPNDIWAITERKASELLAAQGYPIDDLCEALQLEPTGWAPGDIIAAYERGDVVRLRADIEMEFPPL